MNVTNMLWAVASATLIFSVGCAATSADEQQDGVWHCADGRVLSPPETCGDAPRCAVLGSCVYPSGTCAEVSHAEVASWKATGGDVGGLCAGGVWNANSCDQLGGPEGPNTLAGECSVSTDPASGCAIRTCPTAQPQ